MACDLVEDRENFTFCLKLRCYWLDERGSISGQVPKIFLFATAFRPALEPTQPPIQWVQEALSQDVKGWSVKLTVHLHLVPRSNNACSYTSTPQYAFMTRCLVKHRDNFSLLLEMKH
jgi:hypothetical protein